MGIFFILLGVGFILWNRRERKSYYNSLTEQRDLKEFVTHEPERPWLSAWRVGGIVSLIVGVMLTIAGAVLWLVLY